MSRTRHAFLAAIWCLYGISALTHSTNFWASILGVDMPHMSMLIIDIIYYILSAVMCPHYIHKGWCHVRICLQHNKTE